MKYSSNNILIFPIENSELIFDIYGDNDLVDFIDKYLSCYFT